MSYTSTVRLSFNGYETQQSAKKKSNKVHVSAACVNCKKAHLACDVSRPCQRCISTDKMDTCCDVQHKKRGRPKMMRDSNNNKIRSSPTSNNRAILFPAEQVTTTLSSSTSNDSMLVILSMDLCCARVTDESLEYLQLYPQEFSHRSIYDFLIPGQSRQDMAKLHRCLLDNVVQHQQTKLPANVIRSSSETFFSSRIKSLAIIANGSLTLKKNLLFQCGGEVKKQKNMSCQFYLGGGLGADLFESDSIHQLYIVCVMSPVSLDPDTTLNAPPSSVHAAVVSGITPTILSSPAASIPPLLLCDPITSESPSPTTGYSLTEEEEIMTDHNNNIDDDKLIESIKTTAKPLELTVDQEKSTQLDRLRNQVHRTKQWIHPHALYYLNTTSSRLSSEAIAHTSRPYLMSNPIEQGKKLAAYRAVDEYITAEHKVVGIGSGSTVVYVVERILQRPELKHIVYVPTSFQSKLLIIEGGLIMGSIEQYPDIDVTIDGADEVDEALNVIKGGGACQFQEKLVAEAAKKFVIVADFRKKSKKLGTEWTKGVPIEVVPMTYKSVMKSIDTKLSLKPITSKLRMAVNKAGPVVTDNGNFVVDTHFGAIDNPSQLLKEIKLLTGVYEVGLFCNMAEKAYFGEEDGSVDIWTK
ncbi:ribose 5-phosphate isomerase A-domain-containing protein [Helicostylum pulchrum]|nr:ribose 5-phosphate isomerase A-domain-containing protein [Helicostylum pulchrum]